MVTIPVSTLPSVNRIRPRTALVASADRSFRQRLSETLTGLRWQVREAEGGAQAWAEADAATPEAVIVDSWLPDLNLAEFLKDFRAFFPEVDLVTTCGSVAQESPRGPYRQELLYALRRTQDNDTAIWNATPALNRFNPALDPCHAGPLPVSALPAVAPLPLPPHSVSPAEAHPEPAAPKPSPVAVTLPVSGIDAKCCERLPDLIGNAPCMLDVSRRVRLVAPRPTPVLIEGPTGSGKELVAEAVHRLSMRSRKPFVAINCAAIPEALLEAELFGHTRGAFTGAVQGRVGRIEAAHGGTLFLDEIGEMPLALQAKLLRFVESGELQRVGENEPVKVDVRIVAATHRSLARLAGEGSFRADLYYRLAVFLIRTPALAAHQEDIPGLVNHFLKHMGQASPAKSLSDCAMADLLSHGWPGNIRELEHVLERASILAEDRSEITTNEIEFGDNDEAI